LVRYDGETTGAAITNLFDKMSADENVVAGLPRLSDIRSATISLTADELIGLARTMNGYDEILRPARAAIIAPEGRSFGLARMFLARRHNPGGDLSVFRSTLDALKWVGLVKAGIG
jgi:hypothetical protein